VSSSRQLTSAETRLLRFLQGAQTPWTPKKEILNTEALMYGDEKALPSLVSRDLVLEHGSGEAYRISEEGVRTLGRTKGKDD
jgi:hypothetical protein